MANKLELTWYGKEDKISVEPRILIENKELSNTKYDENTENMLIHGDNLLALKALERKYAGQVKCIYIDPPYNTGAAFSHYDDNLEHSTWLSLMRPRLELLRDLLSDDGSIWISIDDDEGHYLKILCDELFGRSNFISTIIWEKKYSPQNDADWFSDNHDFLLVYAKNKEIWRPNLLPRTDEMNARYKNPDNDPRGPWKPADFSVKTYSASGDYPITLPSGRIVTPPPSRAWGTNIDGFKALVEDNRIWFGETGDNVPSNKKFLFEVKQGVTAMTIWKYKEVGHNQDAKKEAKAINPDDPFPTPKPERLLERVLTLATNENDLVLDSFLGSGTTAAVAHKMNRRWIGIEMGNHAYSDCKVRLDKVIDGSDQGGISISKEYHALVDDDLDELDLDIEDVKSFNRVLNKIGKETDIIPPDFLKLLRLKTKLKKIKKESVWSGGGGYRFYELAPTLINEDSFGEPVINKEYSPEMLASAVALHEGYTYEPSDELFWKQSKGNEKSFLFVTTRFIDQDYLARIKETMQDDEFLIIACKSYEAACESQFENIKIKKIPNMLLSKCEFGREDYNLNIISPPVYDEEDEFDE